MGEKDWRKKQQRAFLQVEELTDAINDMINIYNSARVCPFEQQVRENITNMIP